MKTKKSVLKEACGKGGPTSVRTPNLIGPKMPVSKINPGGIVLPQPIEKTQPMLPIRPTPRPYPGPKPYMPDIWKDKQPIQPIEKTQPMPLKPGRGWGESLPGDRYPAVEGPGNPSWERRNAPPGSKYSDPTQKRKILSQKILGTKPLY